MADDSVKFTINISENVDKKTIDEEVKKQLENHPLLKKIKEQETKQASTGTPKRVGGRKVQTFSSSPIDPPEREAEGGIFGRVDPGVKGFQKRKAIRGSVERFRDDRSKAAHSQERYIVEQLRLQRQVHSNAIDSGAIKKIIENHMGNLVKGSQVLSNPQGFVGDSMIKLLGKAGPHGAAVVAAITAIVVAPEVIAEMIKVLSVKGLPLNDDWKRVVEEEVNGLFNTEEKKRRLLGIDSYIVTQQDRYQPDTGSTTINSFENREEIVISKIGLAEKSVGVEY